LIQPAGLARPQIGLQPAGGAQRWNAPARQGSTYLRTAINAQSPSARRHAGEDARAPRTHMLQSFRPSLQAVRTPQPAQAGFALDSRGLQPDGTRCIADLMLNLHQPDGTQARRPRTQDDRAPRTHMLSRTRAGTPALPGRPCYATRGRGRPRTQDVRGSVMLPHDLKAHSSPARTLSHFRHQDAPHPPFSPCGSRGAGGG
jgi:hypothetical protein